MYSKADQFKGEWNMAAIGELSGLTAAHPDSGQDTLRNNQISMLTTSAQSERDQINAKLTAMSNATTTMASNQVQGQSSLSNGFDTYISIFTIGASAQGGVHG